MVDIIGAETTAVIAKTTGRTGNTRRNLAQATTTSTTAMRAGATLRAGHTLGILGLATDAIADRTMSARTPSEANVTASGCATDATTRRTVGTGTTFTA